MSVIGLHLAVGDQQHCCYCGKPLNEWRFRSKDEPCSRVASADFLLQIAERLHKAERSLSAAGYSDLGGEAWKPPLGKRLAIAAPDLLAACKSALSIESQIRPHDSIIGPNERLIRMLTEAIAKAEPTVPTSNPEGGR